MAPASSAPISAAMLDRAGLRPSGGRSRRPLDGLTPEPRRLAVGRARQRAPSWTPTISTGVMAGATRSSTSPPGPSVTRSLADPDGHPRGQRHRDHDGPGGGATPRHAPRRRGVLVVGVRRQSRPAETRGHGADAGQPVRRQQARRRGVRPRPTDDRSGFRCSRSASSTSSDRCNRPGTPTPPWCRPSSRAPSPAQPLPVHGDGTQTRDFTFVGTVVSVLTDADSSSCDRSRAREPGLRVAGLAAGADRRAGAGRRPMSCGASTSGRGRATCTTRRPTGRVSGALFPEVRPTPLQEGLQATVAWFQEMR